MKKSEFKQLPPELLEQAAFHLMILDERPMTSSERVNFKAWLGEDSRHPLAFEQVASLWGKMDVLQGLADICPIESAAERNQPEQNQPLRAYWKYWKGAAAACLIAVSVLVFSRFDYIEVGSPEPQLAQQDFATEIQTEVGQLQTLDMVDGSRIVANTNSRLSVSITETERRIVLDHGEAFFEVEHDPSRTFDVVVGDTIVRAIGTAFSVYRDQNQLKVIVTEGVVELIPHVPNQSDAGVTKSEANQFLHPGQVAEISSEGARVETIEQDELARKLTWRSGMLAFDGEPLEAVIEEFSRYNHIKLEIGSDSIREIRVGGYFNSGDVAGMLNALEGNFGVKVTYLDTDHVLLTNTN